MPKQRPAMVVGWYRRRALWIFAMLVIPAALIALAIHDFLGHGATALLVGGRIEGWGVGLPAISWIHVSVPSRAALGLVKLMGPVVTYVASIATAFLILPRARAFAARSLLVWLGVGCALDFPLYSILGAFGVRQFVLVGGTGEPQAAFDLLGVPEVLAPVFGVLMLSLLLAYRRPIVEIVHNIRRRPKDQ